MLSGRRIQIKAWFSASSEIPIGATVRVLEEDGRELIEGKITDEGTFSFRIRRLDSYRVIISDRSGHRTVVRISQNESASAFRRDVACQVIACFATTEVPTVRTALLLDLQQAPKEVTAPPLVAGGDDVVGLVLRALMGVGILTMVALVAMFVQHRRRLRDYSTSE